MLAVQIHLTTLNAKAEMQPELIAEFARELSPFPLEAIQWAFTIWRRGSQFNPALSDIWKLVQEWKRAKLQQEALQATLDERSRTQEGRKQGLVPELYDVLKQLGEIAKNMKMPEVVRKLRNGESRFINHRSPIPAIATHLTADQRAARLDQERAEIEHYKKLEKQRDGIYEENL